MASRRSRDLESSAASRAAWTNTPVAYDIIANDPQKGNQQGRPCRGVTIGVSGTLVYTGLDNVDVTLQPMGIPWRWDIQAKALKATSTAQNVVVHW